MEQITSIAYLLSTAGTVALVTLVTQYLKQHIPERIPVRIFVLALCMIIQVGLTLIVRPTVEAIILAVANSFVAAAASFGAYEATINREGNG